MRILISSWSNNWIKGFEIYQYIDFLLEEFVNIDVDFIGRSPIGFRNIKNLGIMEHDELIKSYGKYDIYLTASLFDPCSNSLAEAISNDCMVIVRDSGGHKELINNYDLCFKNQRELYFIFKNLKKNYELFLQRKISSNFNSKNSFELYLELFSKLKSPKSNPNTRDMFFLGCRLFKLILYFTKYKLNFIFGLKI